MKQPIYAEFSEKRWKLSRLFGIASLYFLALLVVLVRSIPLGWLILGLGIGIVTGCIGGMLDVKTMDGKAITFKGSEGLLRVHLWVAAALLILLPVLLAIVVALDVILSFYCAVANVIVLFGTFILVDMLFLYAYHKKQGPLLVITGYKYEDIVSTEKPTIKIKAKIKPGDTPIDDEDQ